MFKSSLGEEYERREPIKKLKVIFFHNLHRDSSREIKACQMLSIRGLQID